MLKFSTFTGAHNKEKQRGGKKSIGARSAHPNSAVVGERLTLSRREEEEGEETSVENEKRYTELRKTQISREKE